MNILYLSELNPQVCSGGGEIILRGVINKFQDLGANVLIRTTNDDQEETINIMNQSEFIFCADMFNEPMNPNAKWFSERVLSKIMDHGNYLTFETGYTGGCSKDYTPCNLSGRSGCHDCPKNDYTRRALFKDANINVFLSPLQAGLFKDHFGLKVCNKHICVPEIENDLFYDMKIERDIELLWVGVVCPAKGLFEFYRHIEKNNIPKEKILIVGDSIVGKPIRGTYIPKMPREELIKIYNRSKYFWGKTLWCEAFGCTTLEAIKCGCKPIFNNNNGCMSYFKYNVEKAVAHNENNSYEKLFEKIKKVMV